MLSYNIVLFFINFCIMMVMLSMCVIIEIVVVFGVNLYFNEKKSYIIFLIKEII